MKTTIYLVRHGETEWNLSGRFQGCIDTELTDIGLSQAAKVGDTLRGSFDYIYTSPLKRAFITSEIIATANDMTPVIDRGLLEINFGLWEGLTQEEMSMQYPKEFEFWKKDTQVAPMCGGDLSIKNCSLRASKAIINLARKHQGSKLVAVAHGGIIKAALIGLFHWDMTMYHKIVIGNTSITTLEFNENGEPRLITLNDVNHNK